MRSVAVATVVVVLMVLRTAARSAKPIETTIEETTETTTVCPTTAELCDEKNCFWEHWSEGECPTVCICGDPPCMVVDCGPDADCVEKAGDYSDYYTCVPR